MLAVLLFTASLQHLEVAPRVAEPGENVEVRAVDAKGLGRPGVVVEVVRPNGTREGLGATDARGVVACLVSDAGDHVFRAIWPNPEMELLTPYRVAASQPRWLYGLALVPLGLALLLVNGRRLFGGGTVREPSRPSP